MIKFTDNNVSRDFFISRLLKSRLYNLILIYRIQVLSDIVKIFSRK